MIYPIQMVLAMSPALIVLFVHSDLLTMLHLENFLQETQRQRLNDETDPVVQPDSIDVSCARTNARSMSRELQIKYDIAKNEDGPLRRTIKDQVTELDKKTRTMLGLLNKIHSTPRDQRTGFLAQQLRRG